MIVNEGFTPPLVFRCFRPVGFWSTLAYRLAWGRKILIPLGSESFVCLDCGIAWTKFDPEEAATILRRKAGKPLIESLGLAEKSKCLDNELA